MVEVPRWMTEATPRNEVTAAAQAIKDAEWSAAGAFFEAGVPRVIHVPVNLSLPAAPRTAL